MILIFDFKCSLKVYIFYYYWVVMLSMMDGCPCHWHVYKNLCGVNKMKLQVG